MNALAQQVTGCNPAERVGPLPVCAVPPASFPCDLRGPVASTSALQETVQEKMVL
jgi:hypothetical protein